MPTSELFQGMLGFFEGSVVYISIVSSTVEICFEMPTSELFQGILGCFEGSVVYILIVSSVVTGVTGVSGVTGPRFQNVWKALHWL